MLLRIRRRALVPNSDVRPSDELSTRDMAPLFAELSKLIHITYAGDSTGASAGDGDK